MAFFISGGKKKKKNKKQERHSHSRDMPNFRRNDTDKRKVIKDKKSILKTGVEVTTRKGVKATLNQLEGSEEAESALMTAAVITSPVTKTAKKTGKTVREQIKKRHIKETQVKSIREKKKPDKKKIHSDDSKKSESQVKERKIHYQNGGVKSESNRTGKDKPKSHKNSGSSSKDKNVKKRKLALVIEKLKSAGTGISGKAGIEDTGSGVGDVVKMIAVKVGLLLLPIVLGLLLIIGVAAIIISLVVALIYNSPFSIFFPPLESGDTVMTVTSQYMAEFNRDINILVTEHKDCDIGKIVYVDYEGTLSAPSNYYDVMSVYMVKYGVGNTATVMDETGKANLKSVFDDMCTYTISTGEEKIKNDEGKKVKKKVLYVNVTFKTYYQMETEYSMSEDEINLLNSLMSQESMAALGIAGGNTGTQSGGNKKSSLSQSEIDAITEKIADGKARTAVTFALSKVGYPYSQPLRNSGTHFDCSSLAYYAWNSAGISIMTGGSNTAAAEAQWCSNNKCTVKEKNLKPGDLIFYSYSNNGRYKNISHVGIYVGDGKIVEAVDEATGVVIQDYHNGGLVMIGRPDKKK